MGVREPDLEALIDLLGRCRRKNSILQIGVISILMSPRAVFEKLVKMGWCEKEGNGYRLRHNIKKIESILNENKYIIREGLRDQLICRPDFLLHALGFDDVFSLDIAPHDQPTHIYDLNVGEIWKRIGRQFDVIVELGTLEHVFNVPNAFWNIAKMCAVGGEVIHGCPMNNWPDHGFYQFSPTLYYDFYECNGFEVVESYIYQIPSSNSSARIRAKYKRNREFKSPVPLDGNYYVFHCRVRKLEERDSMVNPFQGAYSAMKNWSPLKDT